MTVSSPSHPSAARVSTDGAARSAAFQLTRLLDDLMDVSRVSTRMVDLRPLHAGRAIIGRSQGGLGIGLALILTLPVTASSAAPATLDHPDTRESNTQSLRVLVVDDDVDTVDSLEMLLKQLGHDVRKAYDGSASLEAALDYRPHVMLLDIGLPGLDGYQLATRIREHPALQDVVLVALTGYGDASARQRSRGAGFDHHLTKPADLGALKRILATALPLTPDIIR